MEKVNITPGHLSLVKSILKKHLGPAVSIWVFGSRAAGNAKPYSDLDLALSQNDKKALPLKTMAGLAADFIEADLPWKVDVIDYNTSSGIFKQNIDLHKIELIVKDEII